MKPPVWIAALGATLLLGLAWTSGASLLDGLKAVYHRVLPLDLREALWQVRWHLGEVVWREKTAYITPWSYAIVLVVFALERVIPAKRQRVLSVGTAQDFLWFNADLAFKLVWLSAFLAVLKGVYDRHLGFLTIHAVEAWPAAARFMLSFLVFDFLNWLHHVIRHRVEILWYFHMIHHSQRQMNLFTDGRIHLMEHLVARTLVFIPMYMFQVGLPTVFWFAMFLDWYTRVYHANLRTHYGAFKYILVTPQSHRIHHSLDPRHVNKNFGLFLTVWDRLFGTLYAKYDEYPETGVDDKDFPFEHMVGGLSLFASLWAQLVYPFRLVVRRLGAAAGWA